MAQKIDCPTCNSMDMIQKVTSIVQGETHQTTGSSHSFGTGTVSGQQTHYSQGSKLGNSDFSGTTFNSSSGYINTTQRSTLAGRLSPPQRPKSPSQPSLSVSTSCLGFIVGVITFILLLVWAFKTPGSGPMNFFVAVLFFLALFGIPIFVGMKVSQMESAYKERSDEHQEKSRRLWKKYNSDLAQYKKSVARWEKAISRWNDMYYCRRCDVAYLPNDNTTPVSVGEMNALCYHGTE